MRPINVWQALARPRYLLTSWPRRSAGYLLSSAPVGLAALVAITVGATVGTILSVVLIGLPFLALLALSGVPTLVESHGASFATLSAARKRMPSSAAARAHSGSAALEELGGSPSAAAVRP
ncbi:sensor domain-containing protein [Streptomyces flavidovirens]